MNATAVKSGNYPQDVIDTMVSEYTANPTRATVAALAEQFGKTDDEVYIRACAYLSTHKNPEDIYNKAREPLKIDIKDPPNAHRT